MPALTLEKHSGVSYFSVGTQTDVQIEKYDNGTALLKGLKVFKVGTFRDSMGVQHTWESVHLEQMVFHFDLLRENDIFTRVPWRDGHPSFFGSGGQVIGHIAELRHEGDYLAADVLLTEPDAVAKWERGTYGPRSLEVGMYETNAEAAYWPVVMGCAFVDIAAVEGLFEKAKQQTAAFATVDSEEGQVAGESSTSKPSDEQNKGGSTAGTEGQGAEAPANGNQQGAASNEGAQGAASTEVTATVETQASPAQHAKGGSFQFSVNGQPTSDFAAVQTHIDSLERFATETREQVRKDFVNALAKGNKILATQVDELTEFALGLTPDQYAKWAKTYDGAAANPLFGKFGTQGGNGEVDARAEEIKTLEETVAYHRRAGRSEDFIKNTDSFKRLEALKAQSAA